MEGSLFFLPFSLFSLLFIIFAAKTIARHVGHSPTPDYSLSLFFSLSGKVPFLSEAEIPSLVEIVSTSSPSRRAPRCWLNQGAPGRAPYLTMFTRREKLYALRALQISQNADIVEVRILVQVRKVQSSEASGSRDGWIFIFLSLPLFSTSSFSSTFFFSAFSSLSSYFSHIIVRSGREKQQHRSICFPERKERPEGNNAILGIILFIRYHYMSLYTYY